MKAMRKFKATAHKGENRFYFEFFNVNWNGVEAAARAALTTLGYGDAWSIKGIDVA
jgi:hypothetical protein